MPYAGNCAGRGTLKSITSGSLWLLSIGSTGRKNTVCLFSQILTSQYQTRICDGMQIESTSDMVNVLEETVALNHHIVL